MDPRKKNEEGLDWMRIEEDFKMWQGLHEHSSFPDWRDVDQYLVTKASGWIIESDLKKKYEFGYSILPGDEDRRAALEDAMKTVQDETIIRSITEGIASRVCRDDFFWAWTAYQRSAAVLLTLDATDEVTKNDFRRQKLNQPSQALQEYIYAFWMYKRWAKNSHEGLRLSVNARIDAEMDLAYEIEELVSKETTPREHKAWLEKMVGRDNDDSTTPVLKGAFLKTSADRLCQIVELGRVKVSDLPALPY